MLQNNSHHLKERFFNGKCNNINYVYFYSTDFRADYKISGIHLLIHKVDIICMCFMVGSLDGFRIVYGDTFSMLVLLLIQQTLSDQDTSENIERIFLCKNTVAR